ncbi:hypothetical protein F5Y15DRAFT_421639 [Xylariaceae sp. FL0016]|nr:hypothetical protein F5Y15DRAFT_421639 [Xylariaceae sp. FL0016]
MTSPSAMEKTLGTIELLEAILAHLDMRTLLVSAQRCKHHWNSVIRSSPTLRRALFFDEDHNAETTPNPLLAEVFPFCYPHLDPTAQDPLQIIGRVEASRAIGAYPFLNIEHIMARQDAFAYKRASWRQMLIQQPPPQGISLMLTSIRRVRGAGPYGGVTERLTAMNKDMGPWTGRAENLLHLVVLGRSGRRYQNLGKAIVSGFRVIWSPVPSDFHTKEIGEAVQDEMGKKRVIVNNVFCFAAKSSVAEEIRILHDVILGPSPE